ncbi:MAG: hypothetical protein ACOCUU_00070 [Nanoarchaeota archaeon]
MTELSQELKKSLKELRKNSKERKFNQTVDLIINLQKFDLKKDSINTIVSVPHKIKDKKIAGFIDGSSSKINTIPPSEFGKYKDKKSLKKLVRKYDFFISQANLMPKVATTFGRALGPLGKMPSPQLGIIPNADDKIIENLIKKINTSIKIKTKEASIKVPVGKQDMKDEEIVENAMAIYNSLVKEFSRGKDNIKNIEIKFTMTKPQKIKLK